MMKSEFEQIAKVTVTDNQYKAIEFLYMESNLEKKEFIKSIKGLLKSFAKETETIITVNITDRCGSYKTPNGCWCHLVDAIVLKDELSISTGKRTIEVKQIENSYRLGYEVENMVKDYDVTFK